MATPREFTLQPNYPSWLLNLIRDRRLTREEGASLAAWNGEYCRQLQSRETDEVFYIASGGELTDAIKNLAVLLRGCRRDASSLNKRQTGRDYRLVFIDWSRARLVDDAALQMQFRAMSYLQEMIAEPEDEVLLKAVLGEYGYQRRAG